MRRILLLPVVAALLLAAALSSIRARRAAAAGFGGARYVWVTASPERGPVRFSILRRFRLEAVPARATARVFVDRRFELWLNGKPAGAGGMRPGDPPAAIPAGPFLWRGENTVAIVAESPDGVGAILFALDAGGSAPEVVTDGTWTADPAGARVLPPGTGRVALLGAPPRYPWGWVPPAGRAASAR